MKLKEFIETLRKVNAKGALIEVFDSESGQSLDYIAGDENYITLKPLEELEIVECDLTHDDIRLHVDTAALSGGRKEWFTTFYGILALIDSATGGEKSLEKLIDDSYVYADFYIRGRILNEQDEDLENLAQYLRKRELADMARVVCSYKSLPVGGGLVVVPEMGFKAQKSLGSIKEGASVVVEDILLKEQRICVDAGSYALTIDEFNSVFKKADPAIETKRQWLRDSLKADFELLPDEDSAYCFYYRAIHDNGMDLSDADRYAWLNTLFGYDIGADRARGISSWLYENGQDVMELGSEDRDTLQAICESELGYKFDYSRWGKEAPEAIVYSFPDESEAD